MFAFFDQDGSGTIEEAEMLAKLAALGFDRRGVAELFRDVGGETPDGKPAESVSREQFSLYLRSTS